MATENEKAETRKLIITPPAFQTAEFELIGTTVLVQHRFSAKLKAEMKAKAEAGKTAEAKPVRTAQDTRQVYNDARYIAKAGWDGFNASAIRNACITACKLCNYKMTFAKLSIFVEADGYDAKEPQIPLVRIFGKPVLQEDMARVANGNPYVAIRPAYHDWRAKVRIRFDSDQFKLEDIANLMSRVGQQVGIGEGRPDSKNSAGMGWGLFRLGGKGD